jgi:hypothetical protein
LQTNKRCHCKEIHELKDLLKLSGKVTKIKATVYKDIQKLHQDLAQVQGGVKTINFATSSRLDNVEHLSRGRDSIVKLREPPYYTHLCFLGDVDKPFLLFHSELRMQMG